MNRNADGNVLTSVLWNLSNSVPMCRERSPSTLTGKVNQLELILRQLQTDLRKVKPSTC